MAEEHSVTEEEAVPYSSIPKRISEYREQEYWQKRYEHEKGSTYDWLLSYERVKGLLLPHLQPHHRILNLGCGNSTLSEGLYTDSFKSICNIDYSLTVFAMAGRHPSREQLVMDMRELSTSLPADSFYIVIDMASLDAICTDGGSQWNPSEELRSDVSRVCDGVLHVLKSGGLYQHLLWSASLQEAPHGEIFSVVP